MVERGLVGEADRPFSTLAGSFPGMCQDAFCSVVTAAQGFSYLSPPLSFSPFDDGWRDGQGA